MINPRKMKKIMLYGIFYHTGIFVFCTKPLWQCIDKLLMLGRRTMQGSFEFTTFNFFHVIK